MLDDDETAKPKAEPMPQESRPEARAGGGLKLSASCKAFELTKLFVSEKSGAEVPACEDICFAGVPFSKSWLARSLLVKSCAVQ